MYGLDEIREAVRNPHLVLRELNRIYYRRFWTREYNPAGIDIFEADWDTLIILDACRYDVFADQATLPGDLKSVISRGAATPEFVRANFADRDLRDTVYVSRNTWFLKLYEELNVGIHAFYHPTSESPTPTTERALSALDCHPNKRLVIHYLPPHHPFVGPTAEEHFPDYQAQSTDLFAQIRRGTLQISDEILLRAYEENLNRVLPEVERILNTVDGRTVVTADHGELLGDICRPIPIRDYGHHSGLYVDPLVCVPWLVHESGERREITEGEAADILKNNEADMINERLRQLGYKV